MVARGASTPKAAGGPALDGVSAARLAAQGLSDRPAWQAADVVERILAVQAQDPRGMRLAVRSRSRGLRAGDVDEALTRDRSLVVTWLNRGTLHLVRSADYWWLHPLTAPRMATQIRRRLAEEGVSPEQAERGVAVVERALERDGPLLRGQLRERLEAADVPTAGQALVYVLIVASVRGIAVRGPVVGGEQAYVLVRDWLGAPPSDRPDRDTALAELARRYLAGHGPADARDLAGWVGLPLGDARRGLGAIAADLVEHHGGLVDLRRRDGDGPVRRPSPRLLGSFDPVLHGWVGRDWVVAGHGQLITSNGIFRPVMLVGGRAAGTWTIPAGRVTLDPFVPIGPADDEALRREAADVERFLAS